MRLTRHCWRWGVVLAVLVLSQATLDRAFAQGDKKEPAVKPPVLEKYAFEMRDKPWVGTNGVLEWLSDKTKLPVITVHKPTGTFNFISPKNSDGKPLYYTIPEVIDILNDALSQQQYILIRKLASITLLSSDQPIPEQDIPRLTEEELQGRGRSELASHVVQLRSLDATDFAKEAKDMLGIAFGRVTVLPTANQLILRDQAGTMRQAIQTIKNLDKGGPNLEGGIQNFTYQCKSIKAADAAETVKKFLGESKQITEIKNSKTGTVSQRIREHSIDVDDGLNILIIKAPADKIATAKDVLSKIDKGPPYVPGPPFLQRVEIPSGNAEAINKALLDVNKPSASLKISNVGPNAILIYGDPESQIKIQKQIAEINKAAAPVTELVVLSNVEASKLADTLEKIFADKVGGPFIEADNSRNALILRGTAQQLKEIKKTIEEITGEGKEGGKGSAFGPTTRVINLDKASAATLAEALQRMLHKMRPELKTDVILPGSELFKKEPKKEEKKDLKPKLKDTKTLLDVSFGQDKGRQPAGRSEGSKKERQRQRPPDDYRLRQQADRRLRRSENDPTGAGNGPAADPDRPRPG